MFVLFSRAVVSFKEMLHLSPGFLLGAFAHIISHRWKSLFLTFPWQSFHSIYVYQIITLYTLNLHCAICYISKREKKKEKYISL